MLENALSPTEPSALVAAVNWLQGTMLGSFATTVAIIAIAWIGFEMLTGRSNIRSGSRRVIGCFILLGAPVIVAGFRDPAANVQIYADPAAVAPAPRVPAVATNAQPFDPYGGSSLDPTP